MSGRGEGNCLMTYRNKEKRREQNDHIRVFGRHFGMLHCMFPLPKHVYVTSAAANLTLHYYHPLILPSHCKMARANFAIKAFALLCALGVATKRGKDGSFAQSESDDDATI